MGAMASGGEAGLSKNIYFYKDRDKEHGLMRKISR